MLLKSKSFDKLTSQVKQNPYIHILAVTAHFQFKKMSVVEFELLAFGFRVHRAIDCTTLYMYLLYTPMQLKHSGAARGTWKVGGGGVLDKVPLPR